MLKSQVILSFDSILGVLLSMTLFFFYVLRFCIDEVFLYKHTINAHTIKVCWFLAWLFSPSSSEPPRFYFWNCCEWCLQAFGLLSEGNSSVRHSCLCLYAPCSRIRASSANFCTRKTESAVFVHNSKEICLIDYYETKVKSFQLVLYFFSHIFCFAISF